MHLVVVGFDEAFGRQSVQYPVHVPSRGRTSPSDRVKADADAVTALLTAPGAEGRPAPRVDVALDIATRAGILA
ncbi:hypothetical protein [Streptomyces erythrochromogenes]|uniref:hypothetical protein n=1 Tax=Streptomyces erythrochromogenes TaxID=285574 RepID=UPI0037F5A36B